MHVKMVAMPVLIGTKNTFVSSRPIRNANAATVEENLKLQSLKWHKKKLVNAQR